LKQHPHATAQIAHITHITIDVDPINFDSSSDFEARNELVQTVERSKERRLSAASWPNECCDEISGEPGVDPVQDLT
jgi:hypothetical protein